MTDDTDILLSEDHTYTVNGIVRVSTTQVLRALRFIDYSNVPPKILEQAQARGKAVHAACHYIEEDDLNISSVDARLEPYIDAYLLMKAETGWKASMREQLVFNPHLNHCGQLDGFGSMAKLGLEEVLPDYKSGVPQNAAAFQTASYAIAIGKPYARRCSIHLKANGRYKILWHRDRSDVDGWKHIVTTYHLREGLNGNRRSHENHA